MSIRKARETGMANQVTYQVVEGWEQLPKGFAHRDVPAWRSIRKIVCF